MASGVLPVFGDRQIDSIKLADVIVLIRRGREVWVGGRRC
jgi:hypothetical protein